MKKLNRLIANLFYLFVFLLPIQTVWIVREGFLSGFKWHYGTIAIYGTEILFWFIAILVLVSWLNDRKLKLNWQLKTTHIKTWLIFFLWVLVAWSGLSIFWSIDKTLSWFWWFRFLGGAALLFIVLNIKLRFRQLTIAILASGVLQSLLAFWQISRQLVEENKWLGVARHLLETPGTFVVQSGLLRWLRPYGSLPHPNILAGFLAISFFSGVYLLLHSKRKKHRWIYPAIILVVAALVATFSRGVCLGVLLAYGFWFFVTGWKKLASWRLSFYLLILIFCLILIFWPLIINRFNYNERLEKLSIDARTEQLAEAHDIINGHSIIGVGLGNYTKILSKLNSEKEGWNYQPVHNIYLLWWSELGLVGLFLILAFVGLLIDYLFIKKNWWGLGLIFILLVVGFFDHFWYTTYFGIMIWWLTIGLSLKTSK